MLTGAQIQMLSQLRQNAPIRTDGIGSDADVTRTAGGAAFGLNTGAGENPADFETIFTETLATMNEEPN